MMPSQTKMLLSAEQWAALRVAEEFQQAIVDMRAEPYTMQMAGSFYTMSESERIDFAVESQRQMEDAVQAMKEAVEALEGWLGNGQ